MYGNLHDHLFQNTWPPSPDDQNTMNYYVWDVVEREVLLYSHKHIKSLKYAITSIMFKIDKDDLILVSQRFRLYIEATIDDNGEVNVRLFAPICLQITFFL